MNTIKETQFRMKNEHVMQVETCPFARHCDDFPRLLEIITISPKRAGPLISQLFDK